LGDGDAQRPIYVADDVDAVPTTSDGSVARRAGLAHPRDYEAMLGRHIALPETAE